MVESRGTVALAELEPGRVQNQRMVEKGRRLRAPKQAGEQNLATGRVDQVCAAHDEGDPVLQVVDRDRELIGPISSRSAREEIAALLGRHVLERPLGEIDERNGVCGEAHPNGGAGAHRKTSIATDARIPELLEARARRAVGRSGDIAARTAATVRQAGGLEPAERRFVAFRAIALAGPCRTRSESEPLEIGENRGLEV